MGGAGPFSSGLELVVVIRRERESLMWAQLLFSNTVKREPESPNMS